MDPMSFVRVYVVLSYVVTAVIVIVGFIAYCMTAYQDRDTYKGSNILADFPIYYPITAGLIVWALSPISLLITVFAVAFFLKFSPLNAGN